MVCFLALAPFSCIPMPAIVSFAADEGAIDGRKQTEVSESQEGL